MTGERKCQNLKMKSELLVFSSTNIIKYLEVFNNM